MTAPEFGATAWGRAWLRTVQPPTGRPHSQLPRARSLARNNRIVLGPLAGVIDATVSEAAHEHRVSVCIPAWNDEQRSAAGAVIVDFGNHGALGDLPDLLVDRLAGAGAPVAVPLEKLVTTCSCRGRSTPCAHILATLYAVVLRIDERPVTAVELRARRPLPHSSPDRRWIPLGSVPAESFYTRDP